jgi:hypothetical protein
VANVLAVRAEFDFIPEDPKRTALKPGLFNMVVKNVAGGGGVTYATQEVGTGDEEIVVSSDIGTYGLFFAKNLDKVNYVEFAIIQDKYSIKLKAGEFCIFRVSENDIKARANAAPCLIEYWIFED